MYSIIQFIDLKLLRGIESMLDTDARYLAFGQIAVGIEFLGACCDSHNFDQPGQSKFRFDRGITDYMAKVDHRYAIYNNSTSPYYLYKYLRCGMAHVLRPEGGKISFSFNSERAILASHLKEKHGQQALSLVLNQFYSDFKKACELLKSDIPSFCHPKILQVYLPTAITWTTDDGQTGIVHEAFPPIDIANLS